MRLEQEVCPAPYGISQVIGGEITPLIIEGVQIIEVPSTPTSGVTLDEVDRRIAENDVRDDLAYTPLRFQDLPPLP